MFRSPNDVSSSDSESGSSSNGEIELSHISSDQSVAEDTTPSNTHQVNLITISLLEFHATVQAAEILNTAGANHGTRYDRHSPEAIALAKRLFASRSRLLTSHGMLVADSRSDPATRQQYLAGISGLGLPDMLRDSGTLAATPQLALAAARAPSLPLDDLRGDVFPFRPNQSAIQAVPRLSAVSRYRTEFSEIKQLGRGGFGTVYHVVNHVDKQPYAVKKIRLDPRRLKRRWQEGGREEVENVLREIRTLASLEHANIVRYFGAWIEGPHGSSPGITELEGSRPPIFRRLLGEKSTETAQAGMVDSHSYSSANVSHNSRRGSAHLQHPESASVGDGIVFGEDSIADVSLKEADGVDGVDGVDEMDRMDEVEATTSTISLSTETDIFSDGDGQGGRRASDHSVNHITLCLQMSLHQLNLAHYLSPQPSTLPSLDPLHHSVHTRHCFHLKPSLSIFLGILSGVQYLHSAGIVHRDLKPANIFLSEDSVLRPGFIDASCLACPGEKCRYLNARIGDFGLVGNIAEELSASTSAPDKVVGTELYRPPPLVETPIPSSMNQKTNGKTLARTVSRATRIDENVDVFALGVLLMELLWRFDTKTERFLVLNALTRSGTLPLGFRAMFGDRAYGEVSSAGEHPSNSTPRYDPAYQEHRQPSSEPGDVIAESIIGMVHTDPAERWDCPRVKKAIERVLRMCG